MFIVSKCLCVLDAHFFSLTCIIYFLSHNKSKYTDISFVFFFSNILQCCIFHVAFLCLSSVCLCGSIRVHSIGFPKQRKYTNTLDRWMVQFFIASNRIIIFIEKHIGRIPSFSLLFAIKNIFVIFSI